MATTLDGKNIDIATVAIRKGKTSFTASGFVYRAYEIHDDGSLFEMHIGRETPEEAKSAVSTHLNHKAVIFAEI